MAGCPTHSRGSNEWVPRVSLRYVPLQMKPGLVTTSEEWKWSNSRAYACGEEGLVKLNCQEWPLRIMCSASQSHSFEPRE
jgi:hypothetical protein